MKSEQRFLQENFIRYIAFLQLVIVLFGLHLVITNNASVEVYILLVITLATFILRFILIKVDYFQMPLLFTLSKFLVLFFYSIFLQNSNNFVDVTSSIFFMTLYVELVLIKEPVLPSEKQYTFIQGLLPLIFGFIVNVNVYTITNSVIYNYVLYAIFIFGLTYCLSHFIIVKHQALESLKKELKVRIFEKESLELEKSKYKLLHNTMSKQKNELEQKNAILNRVSAEMYTQSELLLYISSVLDIEELTALVTDSIIGAIGVDTCMLFIHEEDSGKQYFKVNTSTGMDLLESFKSALIEGLYKEYFDNGKAYMDSNVDCSDYPFIEGRDVGSIIIVPLLRKEVTYGLLIAEHRTPDMFDENSLNFFKSTTSQISIAVNNANIYMKMEAMAIRDGLTGLFNRSEIQKNVSDLIYNRKEDEHISLALFDIDRFKRVNDTYGHLFGDEAIKAIAEVSKRFAKQYDCIAGRYGGEEFVLLMPGKTLKEAEVLAKEFHQAIKDIKLFYEKTTEVRINVSMGISECPSLANDTESLLSRADNAMYYAKQNGRGQVIIDHSNFTKTI